MNVANRTAVAGLTVAALIILAGCGGTSSGGANAGGAPGQGGRAHGGAILVGRVESLHPGSVTAAQVAGDETAFGFALFDKLCSAAPTSNLTLSPASAAEALGMLDAGSVGATRMAVGQLLHLPGWSPALVAALHAQSAALAQVSPDHGQQPRLRADRRRADQAGLERPADRLRR